MGLAHWSRNRHVSVWSLRFFFLLVSCVTLRVSHSHLYHFSKMYWIYTIRSQQITKQPSEPGHVYRKQICQQCSTYWHRRQFCGRTSAATIAVVGVMIVCWNRIFTVMVMNSGIRIRMGRTRGACACVDDNRCHSVTADIHVGRYAWHMLEWTQSRTGIIIFVIDTGTRTTATSVVRFLCKNCIDFFSKFQNFLDRLLTNIVPLDIQSIVGVT